MHHQGGGNRGHIETLTAGDWAYLSPGLRTTPEFWGNAYPVPLQGIFRAFLQAMGGMWGRGWGREEEELLQ